MWSAGVLAVPRRWALEALRWPKSSPAAHPLETHGGRGARGARGARRPRGLAPREPMRSPRRGLGDPKKLKKDLLKVHS